MATTTDSKSKRQLHGLDCAVNAIADHSWFYGDATRPRFPNAISDHSGTPLMVKERRMIDFMNEITDKPDWTRKINDEAILDKWRVERAAMEKTTEPVQALTEKMFNYCLEELQDYAKQYEETGFVPAIDSDTVVLKSDTAVSEQLRTALKAAAAPLEDVPAKEKDWHPESDEKVLDLVHPSLFPLLYGRSRVLPDGSIPLDGCEQYIGKGEVVPVPAEGDLRVSNFAGLSSWRYGPQHFYSARFQWLPCEVAFGEDDTTKITSYINNLHSKFYSPLYEVIEKIIAKTIPMWDATLSSTDSISVLSRQTRIDIDEAQYIEPTGKRSPEPDEDEMNEDEIWEADEDWQRANRTLIMPEPSDYASRAEYIQKNRREDGKVDLRKTFGEQGLQIIVKLANIHLTPEKPDYAGGAWHIEGALNEHICASALYYYDSENITDSHLAFRESIDIEHLQEKPYEQGDFDHFENLYDIRDQEAAIQVLGKVNTKEGRLLTFPNVLQHKVEPFELVDKSRPGHRKILALFLVDPHTPIPSTAHVPPQQKNWWRAMVHDLDRVADLPPELAERVVDSEGDVIDMEEAKALRLELMAERKLFVKDVDDRFHQETFGFCEH